MSNQKGNVTRNRPQKHRNVTRFENDKYDTSKQTKKLNSMAVTDLCERCKSIIEWKIQFKKYKPLSVPRKCTKCEQKCITKSYRIICDGCANELGLCTKCTKNEPVAGEVENECTENLPC